MDKIVKKKIRSRICVIERERRMKKTVNGDDQAAAAVGAAPRVAVQRGGRISMGINALNQ